MAHFKFDFVSFLAGFVAATILWLLVWRLRANWSQIRDALRKQSSSLRKKNLLDVETYLKQGSYRRAQKQHLAAALFPLEEILIPPLVIAPPAAPDSNGNLNDESMLEQVLPYLPDWPELGSEYGYLTRPLSEIAAQHADLALIGRPGVGKTTTLADLAISIVQKKIEDSRLLESFPIFLHVLDLSPILLGNEDAALALVNAVTAKTAVTLQKQATTAVRVSLQEGRALLLLDGLDELPPTDLPAYTKYIQNLKSQFPNLQIIAACSDVYLDGLLGLGFTPIAVASWTQLQVRQFVTRWGQIWKELIHPQITKELDVPQPDPLAMENWITTEGSFYTPFEWTELVWGAYAGDLSGNQPQRAIAAHLKRVSPDKSLEPLFGALASEMYSSGKASLSFDQAEDLLTRFSGKHSGEARDEISAAHAELEADLSEEKGKKNVSDQLRKGTKVVVQTPGEKLLLKAIEQGLIAEYGENQVAFTFQLMAAYLAASFNTAEITSINPQWSYSLSIAQFCACDGKSRPAILNFLNQDNDPLRTNLSRAGRILVSTPPNSELRIQIMRHLIGEISREQLPFGTRARMMTACAISNDPSVALLFRQWLNAPSANLRRLAALGSGLLRDPKSVGELSNLLGDADFHVHSSAALALTAIPGDGAANSVSLALSQGVETIRRAVAEALAVQPGSTGREILKEAVTMEDLLIRRAAVFGLAMLRNSWAHDLLSKVAVEDGQWVVRNAAAQTIEQHQQPDPHIPVPKLPFWESPWLITFAGKHGEGVSPDEPPLKLLFLALNSGTPEDRAMALEYLELFGSEDVRNEIRNLLSLKEEEVSEKALQSLWCLSTGSSN
ncbi:predicted NTPase [Longilinea arvoryzae]|uniref:Predicted NTPase n=1 Tax=Longilinea arvoryzae TaxID=360412 RepID=A0A0S7BI28_9CHLR|nr:HEAT repeat domain-containing protein [Longilinea arvoryzae]GAP14740.1 predicted NTPase [Longilinea arvoryzae]